MFDGLNDISGQNSKNESCLSMSLEYSFKISASLEWYNFIYGLISTNWSVLGVFVLHDLFEVERELFWENVLHGSCRVLL